MTRAVVFAAILVLWANGSLPAVPALQGGSAETPAASPEGVLPVDVDDCGLHGDLRPVHGSEESCLSVHADEDDVRASGRAAPPGVDPPPAPASAQIEWTGDPGGR